MRKVTTRQLKKHLEREKIKVFNQRRPGDTQADQKMVNLVEMERRLQKQKR